ncbi:MAG: choice-of-anchor U domain-containing protein, partial [Gammaproteobacteria bacterium]
LALPVVTAVATQGGKDAPVVVPSGGAVTITAATDVTTGVTYDWSASDAALKAANTNGTTGSTFVFNPAALPDGPLTARLTITDTTTKLQNTVEVPLSVNSALTLAQAQDDNGNGIPNVDDSSALLPTQLQGEPNNSTTFLLQSSVGKLALGTLAQQAGAQSGKFAAGLTAANFPADPNAITSCVGGCFDFVITGVPKGGAAQVVLPLSAAIPANAAYRKFVNGTWRDFLPTGTGTNPQKGGQLASAPGGPGTCPPPGDPAYTPGLTAGDFCVQLTLNDGGRNDADLTQNGTIVDPGGVASVPAPPAATVSSVGTPNVGASGCSISPTPVSAWRGGAWWLIGAVMGWFGFVRRRRGGARDPRNQVRP